VTEQRLDELAAALGRTRPVLDDIARARIAAGIQAAHDRRDPARHRVRRVGWLVGGALAAAVALAAVIGLRPRPAEPTVAVAPAPGVVRLPDGVPLLAARDATVIGELGQATVTLYGRGWATHQGHRLTVEAEAFVVDRPAGNAPVEVAARGATIQVLHATFAVASSSELRVTVIRGELVLRCPGAEAASVVTAGQAARCEPAPPAPASARPAPAPPGGPPPAPPRVLPAPAPPGGPPPATGAGEPSPAAPARRVAATAPLAPAAAASPARPELPAPRPVDAAVDAASQTAVPTGSLRAIAPGAAEPGAPPPPPAAPAARYAEAERLMASDADAARRVLRALVADAPGAPEAAPALLDLARLAAAGGDHPAALAALDELARHPGGGALAMPAAYLRCLVTQGDARRRACFAAFRAQYPGSPHDADALAWLAAAAARAGDCATAQALIGEFLERYADAPAAPAIRAWKARCDPAAAPP